MLSTREFKFLAILETRIAKTLLRDSEIVLLFKVKALTILRHYFISMAFMKVITRFLSIANASNYN